MKNMAILDIHSKKLTKFYIISAVLAILFLISPLSSLFLEKWTFTIAFIHESGHAYFDLLFGDPSTTISTNPPSTHLMISDKFYIYTDILKIHFYSFLSFKV